MPTCPECQSLMPPRSSRCSGCGWSAKAPKVDVVSNRAKYLDPRDTDDVCRIHKTSLDTTGYCSSAQAWWYPAFRCQGCAGPLWDNGYCSTCTPKTDTFPGDYFEQRWDALAGREWGHYVRVHKGPTKAPGRDEVAGYLAELKAIGRRIGQPIPVREPGDEAEVVDEVPF